uniref:Uncharacterized protein n=1 Tax=Nelumbo nucifera TaxID=4432 RepID=A0A823A040_NELNU|nr:TPA_asm: hypothetical protein HUJ06_017485 [Nelumbo nucifera]
MMFETHKANEKITNEINRKMSLLLLPYASCRVITFSTIHKPV